MVTKECSWPVVPRRGNIARPLAPPLLLSLPLGGTVLLSGGVPFGGRALLLLLLLPTGPEIELRRAGVADDDAAEVAEYPGLWLGFRCDLGPLFAEMAWTLSIAWSAVPTLPCWFLYIACARFAGAGAALSLAPLPLVGILSLLPFAPFPMAPALPSPPPLLPLADAELRLLLEPEVLRLLLLRPRRPSLSPLLLRPRPSRS